MSVTLIASWLRLGLLPARVSGRSGAAGSHGEVGAQGPAGTKGEFTILTAAMQAVSFVDERHHTASSKPSNFTGHPVKWMPLVISSTAFSGDAAVHHTLPATICLAGSIDAR